MKTLLACALLIAGVGSTQAAINESITLNLSALNPGSTLSGTFALSNSPMSGDTAPVLLSFSDPSDYSPTSLMATITIGSGLPSGFVVFFSELMFTNVNGMVTPIDTRDVDLTPFSFARCASFPCTSSGGVQDRSPAVFTSTYTLAPAAVPEPGYFVLVPFLLMAMVGGRRLVRPV